MSVSPEPHPPDLPLKDAATRFMTGLWRLHRELGHELDPLLRAEANADPRMYFLLKTIQDGANYPKTLSECLGIPPNLLSRFLTELHGQDLIAREVDAQDSRRVRLSVTPAGLDLLSRAESVMHRQIGARLAPLPAHELGVLLSALERLSFTDPTSPPACPAGTGPHP